MALQFYLDGTQIYPTVNSTITERIGTFSDATLPLEISNIKSPFLPMSHLRITNDDEDDWNFVVVADDVETISKDGSLFRHNLTIRSAAYENTKHILRNTRFSQPPRVLKGVANFPLAMYMGMITPSAPWEFPKFVFGKDRNSHNDLEVNSRMKINRAVLHLRTDMWEYLVDDDTRPEHHSINAHNVFEVIIIRYDGNSVHGTQSCIFGSRKTEFSIDLSPASSIFKNLNDNTRFELKLANDFNYTFNPVEAMARYGFSVSHVELEVEAYYYSMYDVVMTLYKQMQKSYNNGNTLQLSCMYLDDVEKSAELDSIIAPELDFTGMTYYQAIYQLFSYIDAIPIVDSNGYLSYEYLNNYDPNKLINDMDSKKADEKINLNDEYYTDKLVANYQNGRQKNAITYPSANKFTRVNTKTLGIPNANDYVLKVSKPIDYVDKVILKTNTIHFDMEVTLVVYGSDVNYTFKDITWNELDISDRVLPTDVYESLDDYTFTYLKTYLQCNCLCYSRGSDYIDLLGNTKFSSLTLELYKYVITAALYFRMGVANTSEQSGTVNMTIHSSIIAKQDLYYRVTYHGLYDGKMVQASLDNKYDGETYVNQEGGQVSLNRMGNNLQGLIAKLGNEVENVTLNVSSYSSRMRVGSIWRTDDGEKFIANVVQTTFSTDTESVIVNAQFTKNFNLLAQYTKIDQQKRFYEISNELTSKGYETIVEYIYLSYDEAYGLDSAINNKTLSAMFEYTLLANTGQLAIDYATLRPMTYEEDSGFAINNYIYLPLHIYGAGNSLCFEMDYDSPINAMNRLTGSGTPSDPYYSKTSLYTEKNGFADKVEIVLWGDLANNSLENLPYLPIANNDRQMVRIDNFKYFKKPNEIFHLNYVLAFLTKPNNKGEEFFVGDKFINDNAIMPNAILPNKVRFNYGYDRYSIIDNKGLGDTTVDCTVGYNENSSGGGINGEITILLNEPIDCNAWALVDENNNVLIASNKEMHEVDTIIFYVIPRRYRL